MSGYVKLFSSILTSTIWREDPITKVVWVTLLAMANKHGIAEGSIPGLANLAGVSITECEAALAKLKAPDPYSRTKDHDGRRITDTDGGWVLLNHAKYRDTVSAEDRREYQADWIRKKRNRQLSTTVDGIDKSTMSIHTDPSPDLRSQNRESAASLPRPQVNRFEKPTLEQVKALATSAGMPESEAERFFNHYESNGWRVGRNPMRSLPHAIQNWKRRYHEFRNYSATNGSNPRNAGTATNPTEQGLRIAEIVRRQNAANH